MPPDTRALTHHIDGLNRRVGKSINGVRQWGLLYANQLEPAAELDAAGNVIASFLYADRPHVPSLVLKGGQTYRILADHLGSVRLPDNIDAGGIVRLPWARPTRSAAQVQRLPRGPRTQSLNFATFCASRAA